MTYSASILFAIIGVCVCAQSAQVGLDWNYDKKGPDSWAQEFEECKGQQQSPINIDSNKLEYDLSLKQFTYLNYAAPLHWNVSHDGHTVNVKLISHAGGPKISIKGSDFDQDYEFSHLNFHWGFNDYHGSEHLIDSDKFPLEMHLYHKSKSGQHTVLAFLFKLSKTDNRALDPLLTGIAIAKNQEMWKDARLSLSSILPELTSLDKYYRYTGSLTSPPCTEGVKWNLFADFIEISHEQLKSFRTNDLKFNYRDPQKLYSRKVFSSFQVENAGNESHEVHEDHEMSKESGCSAATKSVFNQANIMALTLVSVLFCEMI